MACHVVVSTLAGDSLLVELRPPSTVAQLKQAVAGSAWGLPTECQRLVGPDGEEPLDDAEAVSPGRYTLVVSLDAVRRDLEGSDALQRRAALQTLGRLGLRGGEEALAAVVASLDDSAFEVRWAAVQAMAHVVEKGNPQVFCAVAARLEDHAPCVRDAAIQAAAQLVERGDPRAIAVVTARLEHQDHEVRQAAVEAIVRISKRGDECCLARLISLLGREDHNVVIAAVEAITRVAEEGNQRAIAGIRGYLEGAVGGGAGGTHRLARFKAKRAMAGLSGTPDRGDLGS